jgi:hypothetical protein
LATGALPALAEPLGESDRLVPVPGERSHDDQPRGRQVALLTMKREIAGAFGEPPGGPQIAGGDGALGGHAVRVG